MSGNESTRVHGGEKVSSLLNEITGRVTFWGDPFFINKLIPNSNTPSLNLRE
jgi:hypothetical protein